MISPHDRPAMSTHSDLPNFFFVLVWLRTRRTMTHAYPMVVQVCGPGPFNSLSTCSCVADSACPRLYGSGIALNNGMFRSPLHTCTLRRLCTAHPTGSRYCTPYCTRESTSELPARPREEQSEDREAQANQAPQHPREHQEHLSEAYRRPRADRATTLEDLQSPRPREPPARPRRLPPHREFHRATGHPPPWTALRGAVPARELRSRMKRPPEHNPPHQDRRPNTKT